MGALRQASVRGGVGGVRVEGVVEGVEGVMGGVGGVVEGVWGEVTCRAGEVMDDMKRKKRQ